MSSTVIKVENLSKQYRLGLVGSGTLTEDLNRAWAKLRGKEDPMLKIGEANDRSKPGSSDYVWSLKDINFDVQQGDVLGIIGKNGAGKSTLLKILSKVTGPTTGSVKVKGRIASLLEVGTGFHPELTGRENIYLNGAILGMKKTEIDRKLDEIVDFSGVERYINTPVKRYSSGMYVRLAFAVAAHLDSEILIVDEVLAVGDAEFQKKCLGKMGDIAKGEGRTVLFVSHNMQAVESLCNRIILLQKGQKLEELPKAVSIKNYLEDSTAQTRLNSLKGIRVDKAHGKRVVIKDVVSNPSIYWQEKIKVNFSIEKIDSIIDQIEFGIGVESENGTRIFTYESKDAYNFDGKSAMNFEVDFEQPRLVPGKYFLSIGVRSLNITLDFLEFVCEIDVKEINKEAQHFGFTLGSSSGYIDSKVNVIQS